MTAAEAKKQTICRNCRWQVHDLRSHRGQPEGQQRGARVKTFIWEPAARADLRRIDRQTALRILHTLTRYGETG
jgi:hypothetical protein